MSTPGKNRCGAKYQAMSLEDANLTCYQDEMSREGGFQDKDIGLADPPRYLGGMDTWRHSLVITKMERNDDNMRQGYVTWHSTSHFGSEAPQGSPDLLKRAHEAVKYSKAHQPNFEHRLYRMSFKSGVQRLV